MANICSVEDDRIPFIILRFLVTFKKSLPSFEKSEPAYLSLLVNVTTKVLLSRNEDKEAFAAMIGIIDLRFLEELLGFIGQDGILCFEKKENFPYIYFVIFQQLSIIRCDLFQSLILVNSFCSFVWSPFRIWRR